jgi:hypothetical protein
MRYGLFRLWEEIGGMEDGNHRSYLSYVPKMHQLEWDHIQRNLIGELQAMRLMQIPIEGQGMNEIRWSQCKG